MILHADDYEDRKYCELCAAYVRYLRSPERSWCADCGAPVRLFSHEDRMRFAKSLERPAGVRAPRIEQGLDSA